MTLLYDSENDFCDRHPRLCTSKVPGLDLSEETKSDEYERYELQFESDRPEFCEL